MAVQPTLCPTVVHEQLGATEALYKRPRLAVTPHDPSVRLPPTAPTLGDICPAPPRPNPQQEQHERLRKRKQRPVTLVEYLDTAVTGRSFAPQYDSSNASVSNEVAVLAYAGLDARRRQKRGLMGALAKRMEAVVEVLKGMVGGGSEGASASVVKVDGVDTPAATVPPSLAASTENLSKEMRASAESVSSSTASLPEVGDGHVVPTAMDVDNTSADQGKVAENVLLGPAEVAAALLEAGVDLDDMSAPLKPRFTSLKDEDHVAAVIEETSVLLAHLHQLQSDRLASVTLSDRSFTTITTDGLLTANARKAMDRLLAPLDVERAAYQRVELNLARLVASVPPQDLVSLEALDGLRHMAAWLGVKDVSYNGTLALRPPIRPVDADTLARQLPHHLGATSGGQRPIFPQTVTAGATAAVTAHMTPVSMPPQVQAQLQAHMVNMTPAQRQAFLHNYGQNMAQNMQRVTGASGSVGPTAAAISAQVAAMLRTPAVVQQQQQQQQQPLSQRVTAITAASATPATARASPTNNANYQCANCGKRESPTWRQGEFPDMKLCNACGLYWGKHHRARPLKETFW